MTYVIRNEDVEEILIGVPKNHKHLRICLKIKDKTLIFQEATIANLVRAYITIKTHPNVKALKLKRKLMSETEIKNGYAKHQLIEVVEKAEEIEKEITELLEEARLFQTF